MQSETSEELRDSPVSAGRKRQLVLAVEDERHDWLIYGKLLWYNGFDVLWAQSGEEGLRLAAEHQPDVILADLVLPGMSGLELCEALKANARTHEIPIIMLSGRSKQEFEGRAMNVGCERYLEKPVGPLEVLRVVEDLVGRPPPPAE